MAAPASYTVGKPTFNGLDWFMYPQGLVKQLKMNGTSSLGGSDIVARFNSDIDFHFRVNLIGIASINYLVIGR